MKKFFIVFSFLFSFCSLFAQDSLNYKKVPWFGDPDYNDYTERLSLSGLIGRAHMDGYACNTLGISATAWNVHFDMSTQVDDLNSHNSKYYRFVVVHGGYRINAGNFGITPLIGYAHMQPGEKNLESIDFGVCLDGSIPIEKYKLKASFLLTPAVIQVGIGFTIKEASTWWWK